MSWIITSTDHFSFRSKPICWSITYIRTAAAQVAAAGCKLPESWSRDIFGKASLTNTLFSKPESAVSISHKANRSQCLAPQLASLFRAAEPHLKFPHLKPHMTQLIHLPERSGESTLLWMCSSGTGKRGFKISYWDAISHSSLIHSYCVLNTTCRNSQHHSKRHVVEEKKEARRGHVV